MKADRRAGVPGQAIFWGIVSLTAYLLLFLNQQVVMHYTTLGGIYAIVVIAIAFVFSFVHGSFANYFIEVIGFKAIKHNKGGH